ncbi:DNA internalization-related competence protein ComEC/Rec2 [Syntrophomonas palmitatica]|uniref:DNA internalization-related competence protein ComEC/Rec2 n=1 Tax=Syntrophomonas palmitatica TaxID=402877 RepID=UPI0006CF4F84|nr:DNA internalization-related competence protein ComEC/Rec2 [Syntrophomonas palmitatica]
MFWFEVFSVLALSIVLAYYEFWFLFLLISAALLTVFTFIPRHSQRALRMLLVMFFSLAYFQLFAPLPVPELPESNGYMVEGVVSSFSVFDGQKAGFVIKTGQGQYYKKYIQVFCYFNPGFNKGDRVRLRGKLKVPDKPGNPGEFDYPSYLRSNRIYYVLSVKDKNEAELLRASSGINNWITTYREHCETLFKEVLPEKEAGVLLGMLLGSLEGIETDEYSEYQKTGIVHIFSVSGLHVGFLLLLTAGLTSWLGLSKRTRLIVGISLLLIYCTLVGWPIPVQRSAVMGALGLIAYYSGRENALLNSLGLAGIVVLLINPCALMQISFQLSFLASWGLVYLFPLLKKTLNCRHPAWDLVLVPFCAQIAIIPLIAYRFNIFNPVSILSNILLSYLSGLAVIMGFLALMSAALLPGLAALILYPAGLMAEIIRCTNHLLVQMPGAYFWAASPGLWIIACYYIGLGMMLYGLNNERGKRLSAGGAALMFLFILVLFIPPSLFNRGTLEMVFIDVGQGDSILLKSPQGKFILIDGGGSEFSDVVHKKLTACLRHRGINDIWLAINTHPDTDHLQGIETVMQEMRVRQVAIPACLDSSDDYDYLKGIAREKEIPLVRLFAGQVLNADNSLQIEVLYPEQNMNLTNNNDLSLVLRLQYGKFSCLLAGDLQQAGISNMLKKEKLLPVNVLKIPHHGSKGSLVPALYEETSPDWAVISVGANNRFGHPSPIVLQELAQRGIKVLRTDQDGAISVRSDGRFIKIEPYRKKVRDIFKASWQYGLSHHPG